MLEIRNVHKYFNKNKRNEIHVINGTSLQMDHGLVALLGPSGCGKTTLLNAIGGLDGIQKGGIYIDGKKITNKLSYETDKIRNLKIGYIFQDYKLIENMSVFDNVAIVLKMIGIKDQKEIQHRVSYVLDKVGMLRYQYRNATNLSGGQRQRVGIARAIVKNPEIILADEPTGNLDSKNSLEIMKIISSIAKTKLVILVTHERQLAEFFASRIVEIQDGTVIKDYENKHDNVLDYEVENQFYLKDFEHHDVIEGTRHHYDYYTNDNEPIHLDIIVKNGNIYIHSKDNYPIQVIDQDSSIELIDDHYSGMNQEDVNRYEFNYDEMIQKDYKPKYSAILNPITLLKEGFIRINQFSLIKKMMLIGFFLSGMFLMYATSSITASLTVKDSQFIEKDRNFVNVRTGKLKDEDIQFLESLEGVDFIVPGTSIIEIKLPINDYYQSNGYASSVAGSVVAADKLDKNDIIYGREVQNEYEVVIDQLVVDRMMKEELNMVGVTTSEQLVGRIIQVPSLRNFTIVGITNNSNPNIYIDRSMMNKVIYYNNQGGASMSTNMGAAYTDLLPKLSGYYNASLVKDYITITAGRMPENDYEVLVNVSRKEEMKLNKECALTIDNKKFVVVGYFESSFVKDVYLVNDRMIDLMLYKDSDMVSIYSEDSQLIVDQATQNNMNAYDSYKTSRKTYMDECEERLQNDLLVSGIIIAISLIEIYLMLRSSFLSRIKEIGIYRAIGVKKSDIYKMFIGEIIAITTILSIPGVLTMAYLMYQLKTFVGDMYIVNSLNVTLTIVLILTFNLFVGLLPVFTTLIKKPAEILSRNDVD